MQEWEYTLKSNSTYISKFDEFNSREKIELFGSDITIYQKSPEILIWQKQKLTGNL